MLFKLFTVYDVVSEVYMQPFCAVTKGSAIRMFAAHVNDPSHPFGKDPKDYILFELGEYEDSNASFKLHPGPISVGVAVEFLKSDESPRALGVN